MRRISTIIAALALNAILSLAQRTPLEKYELAPDAHMEVFMDYVAQFNGKSLTTTAGDYIGQTQRDNQPCGYGIHIGNDGSRVTGMFRQGRLFFGITQTPRLTMVGSPEHYVAYSNTTGRVEYVMRQQEQMVMQGPQIYDYGFVTMQYANGDHYTGEIYMNRRHGFGIYYYANGDIWYGPYENDLRNGFGVLFTEEDGIILGEWRGEEIKKVLPVKLH